VSDFWAGLNYELAGGTPVLGVNAPVIIGHGKSTPLAIKNMVLSAERAVRMSLVERLRQAFA
jgi:glycerol-3-phosphate acyltransferase PlsX